MTLTLSRRSFSHSPEVSLLSKPFSSLFNQNYTAGYTSPVFLVTLIKFSPFSSSICNTSPEFSYSGTKKSCTTVLFVSICSCYSPASSLEALSTVAQLLSQLFHSLGGNILQSQLTAKMMYVRMLSEIYVVFEGTNLIVLTERSTSTKTYVSVGVWLAI